MESQWGAPSTNTEEFSGLPGVVDDGGYMTTSARRTCSTARPPGPVGPERTSHAVVQRRSRRGRAGGALDATLSDWADRTHAQGGTVVAAHFPRPNGEPAVLVATVRADAVEMLTEASDAMLEHYRDLNCGYRLPLVGGTDKMASAVPVGLYRTYARLDEEFSYEAWCRWPDLAVCSFPAARW